MRRSKVFLFFFIFILLFSQQQLLQGANAQDLTSAGNFSSDQSLQNSGLPATIIVYMLKVNEDGDKLGPYDYCYAGHDFSTGCVERGSGIYPPDALGITYDVICDPNCAKNPMRVDVEGYYLDNVLPREMNVAENTPTLPALKAQALAARSIAGWKPDNRHNPNFKSIDNSTDFQVFRPGSLDYYYPSAKSLIQQAVDETSGQYLYYDDGQVGDLHKLSIDAEFGSDALNATFTDPAEYPKPYLTSVSDPISNNGSALPENCKAINNGNLEYPYAPFLEGMSQKGAIRWSLGDQCTTGGNDSTKWSVQWTDYRQILVHYYTGIDILDGSGSKVAPDDRWNLLNYDIAANPQVTVGGDSLAVKITVQNTSAKDLNWAGDDVVVNYQWTANDVEAKSDGWLDFPTPEPVVADIGNPPVEVDLLVPPPLDTTNGTTQTLHLDLKKKDGARFSSAGWPDAQITGITVVGGSTPTPTSTNYALSFKPSVVSYLADTNLDFGGDMTIEFWIRTTSLSGGWGWWTTSDWILNKDITNEGQKDWAVVIHQGCIVFNNGNPSGGRDQPLYSTNINDGIWHHIAIVRDVSTSTGNGLTTIYVDGAQNNSGTFSTASLSNTLPLTLGSFSGDIDDLRLWNIPRSQIDIQNNKRALLNGNEPGLAGYWNFNEGNGLIANDSTQNHINGQLRGIDDPQWILASELFNVTATPAPQPTVIGATSTALPPGFTPLPPTVIFTPVALTSTPLPMVTPTPIPPTVTPAPTSCGCSLQCLWASFVGQTAPNNVSMIAYRAASAIQSVAFDIQVFYRVRDEILSQTPEGQNYVDLYYTYDTEISGILQRNPELADEAVATLQLWQPNLQALIDGNGNTAIITAEQVQAIQTFLGHLSAQGSPALQQTIATERARRPLEDSIGMTMDQAWNYLNGYQLTWLPPLATKKPYNAQQGRIIPIEFTLTDMDGNFVEDQSVTLRVLDANGFVVLSSVGISGNPAQGIVIQGHPQGAAPKYHYNLDTSGLQKGSYALQVLYNSTNPQQPSVWQVMIVEKK